MKSITMQNLLLAATMFIAAGLALAETTTIVANPIYPTEVYCPAGYTCSFGSIQFYVEL